MDETEYLSIPQIEWVVYENFVGLTRREVWKKAVASRTPAAIERLAELLASGVERVPVKGAGLAYDTINAGNLFVLKGRESLNMAADDRRVIVVVTSKTAIKRMKPKDPFNVTFEEMMGMKSTKVRFTENQVLFLVPDSFEEKPSSEE